MWLDQIRRSLIESGELKRLVEECSLRGVTSNPAIFEKAILGSDDYDEDIEKLAKEGQTADEIYLDLAIKDIQMACDVLRPGVGGARRGRRVRLARGRGHAGARHRWHAQAGARAVGRRRPAQRDDQDPGHRGGAARHRGLDRRRHQRERDAAVLGGVLRGRHRALHQRARAPPRGRRGPRRALGGELLRLARGLRGGQAPGQARPRGPQGQGRDRQRPGRLPELQGHLRGRALRRAARRRRLRAAPAVGLHRREGPQLLRHEVRGRRWWRRTR